MTQMASEKASTPVRERREKEGGRQVSLQERDGDRKDKGNAPLRTKNLGHVPPRLETVLRSCERASKGPGNQHLARGLEKGGGNQTHGHVGSSDQGISDLGVER